MERLLQQFGLDPGMAKKVFILEEVCLELVSEGHELREHRAVCLQKLQQNILKEIA